jgi:hypothetical protein
MGNKWCIGRPVSEETKEKMRQAMLNNEWHKSHRLSNEERIARARVRQTAKRFISRILLMTRKRKDRRTEDILGYTKEQLRSHLESKFKDGMSWENRSSFHVDHIIPVAYFISQGITDIAKINALSNLQVLTPTENHKKSASIDPRARQKTLTATFTDGKVSYTDGLTSS